MSFARRHARRLVAIALVATLYGFARLPETSDAERGALAARFSFSRQPLPVLVGDTPRFVRPVNPSLARISAWISSVGAAVALHDLDGDGLPNDVCYVDTRTDRVIVTPVPGSPQRYATFSVEPGSLPYDRATMAPMGCLPGDFNEDGLPDLLVYYWGRTPIVFLRGDAARVTPVALSADRYVAREVVPGRERWFTNAATLADLDGDGHVDIVIGNYFPDGSRILDANATEPDQMQHSMSRAFNGGGPRFLLWKASAAGADPRATFEEARDVLDPEATRGWVLAVGAADLDADLLPEIYVANDFGPDRLLHNRSTPGRLRFARLEGRKGFFVPNSKVIGRDSFKGMGVDFGDLNGDGHLDIYVSNIAAEYALEESHFVWINTGEVARMRDGVAPFVDHSEPLGLSRSGWGWEARLADFDNDGVLEALQATGFVRGSVNRWPELHELAMGNDELLRHPRAWHRFQPGDDLSGHQRSPFFVRGPSGRYVDVAREVGLGEPEVRRGIAVADVDGDGRLDLAIATQWDTSYVYRTTGAGANTFLGLHLLLPVSTSAASRTGARAGHPASDVRGRPAIGATATLTLPDGRRLTAQVDGGNGHSGKRSPELHFGLGALPRDKNVAVDLTWRDASGRVQHERIALRPGWHTVLLAAGPGRRTP
jgi:hypothetical protein